MRCERCDSKLATQRVSQAFDPSLPEVLVDGLERATCPVHGDAGSVWPKANGLFELIIGALLNKPSRLVPDEVAFLRKLSGLKAIELAEVLGVGAVQISRWEHGAQPISTLADRLLRMVIATRCDYTPPDLRTIGNKRAEPLTLRVELGRKGWRIVKPKAKPKVAA
jgi:DNA-binding transcriptional regulator YiaG